MCPEYRILTANPQRGLNVTAHVAAENPGCRGGSETGDHSAGESRADQRRSCSTPSATLQQCPPVGRVQVQVDVAAEADRRVRDNRVGRLVVGEHVLRDAQNPRRTIKISGCCNSGVI